MDPSCTHLPARDRTSAPPAPTPLPVCRSARLPSDAACSLYSCTLSPNLHLHLFFPLSDRPNHGSFSFSHPHAVTQLPSHPFLPEIPHARMGSVINEMSWGGRAPVCSASGAKTPSLTFGITIFLNRLLLVCFAQTGKETWLHAFLLVSCI